MADFTKKLFIVGDTSSGKTAIVKKFCNIQTPLVSLPTTLEKYVTEVEISGQKFELNIWETICSRHFIVSGVKIRQSIYKDVDLVLITFDISRRKTLENVLEKWHNEVLLFSPKRTPIVLIGNKKDTRYDRSSLDKEKPVDYVEGFKTAEEIGAIAYVECSAITGEGVQDIFVTVAKALNKKKSNCAIL